MKIALGQMHIRWEDKAANLARVEELGGTSEREEHRSLRAAGDEPYRVFHAYGTDKRDR